MKLLAAVLVVSAGCAVQVPAAFSAPPGRPRSGQQGVGILVPKHPRERLPVRGGTVESLNWSGYAVTGRSVPIRAVDASFIVPAAGPVPPGFAATWTGIGGYTRSDLIQAGVAENSLHSNPLLGPQYYPFYELLPGAAIQLSGCRGDASCGVTPGDRIRVRIAQAGSRRWSIAVRDRGKWRWSRIVRYRSSRSSAEWILEAPQLLVAQTPLAQVGVAHFGPVSTYTNARGTHPLAAGRPTKLVLSPGAINEATPSSIPPGGQSFNDCAYAQTCPAP